MKKIIHLFLFALFIVSCNSADQISTDKPELIGEWNWIVTEGGINGTINETPTSTKNTIHLILRNNSTFTVTKNGSEILNGPYKLSVEKSIYTGQMEPFISLETIDALYLGIVKFGIVTFEKNQTLKISDNKQDGISSRFVKIK